MALVLSEEQIMLRDSAAGFLSERATVSHLRQIRDSKGKLNFDADVWQEMVDMGWAGITIGEKHGGLGYGHVGLGILMEQVGCHLSPSPLQSTVLVGATLISELGNEAQRNEILPKVSQGSLLLSLALQEGSAHKPEYASSKAKKISDGFLLSGEKVLVIDASVSDQLIVIARTSGDHSDPYGLTAFVVPTGMEEVSIERTSMVDSRDYGRVNFSDVLLPDSAVLGEVDGAWEGLSKGLDIATIGFAAELLGLSEEAFQRTVKYLQERKQFGSFIGSFQALQHRAAEIFAELELCRSIVVKALQAIDENSDELPLLASAAKAKLCEVAQKTTNEAIQMHGGVGMTDEYEIGFFIKRARVIQHLFGDYNYHLDRYALLSGF